METYFINHIDRILALGDEMFNQLHHIIMLEAKKDLPKIDQFICFSQMIKQHTIDQNVAPLIFPNRYYRLTSRELDCLRLAGDGKTAEETAMILGLSIHTVRIHLFNIRQKMDALSIRQCLVTAAHCRLL